MADAPSPVIVDATITRADALGVYRVLEFAAPEIAATAVPGQFVMLGAEPLALLRRPFSIFRVEQERVSVAFDAIGVGTEHLASLAPGRALSVMGPLGIGFDLDAASTAVAAPGRALAVGGGYGTAALVFLADALRARGDRVDAILGARSTERLFLDDAIAAAFDSVTVVTDDGSRGEQGTVMGPLDAQVAAADVVYGCGPNPMLDAVAARCVAADKPSSLAIEEFMACGIGICWTCVRAVETPDGVKNLRVCTDGPVFTGAAMHAATIGTAPPPRGTDAPVGGAAG